MALQPLFEMGFTPSFVRAVAYVHGGATDLATGRRSDGQENTSLESEALLDRVCSTMRWVYTRLALGTTAILALGGTLALRHSVAEVASVREAWGAWSVILFGSFLTFRNLSYSTYLQGANRIPDLRRVEIAGSLISVVANAIALLSGGGLVWLALTSQACTVAATEWNRAVARRRRPTGFGTDAPPWDWTIVRAVWPSTWRSGIGIMMSQGVVQLSAIGYAQLGSPAQVAALLFSLRILQILLSMCQAPFYSKIPHLARLYAEGRRDEQLRLASRGMALSYWVYAVGIVAIGLGLPPLLHRIGSHISFVDARLWFVIGLAYLVERFGAMHIQLYSLTNHIIWHRANGIAGAIYILVLWAAFRSLALYAFPLAIFAGYLGFYSWYAAIHSYRSFGMRFWHFEPRISMAPAALILLAAAVTT
jgi:hypothetical protein